MIASMIGKRINEAASFVLELGIVAAFAYFGFAWFRDPAARWIVGLGLPALTIVLWGILLAPRSARRLGMGPGLVLSTLLYLCASAAWMAGGQVVLGAVFLAAGLVNRLLALVWKQW